MHVKQRRKIYEKIDEKLLELINQYENGELTPTEFAIESGKAVTIKKTKKLSSYVNYVFSLHMSSLFL